MQLINKRNLVILAIIVVVAIGVILSPQINDYRIAKYQMNGGNYLAANDLDNAEKNFKKALTLNPESYFAHYGLGKIAFAKSDFDAAEDYFLKTLDLKPNFSLEPRIHTDLAAVYLMQGNYQKSVDYANQVTIDKVESAEEADKIESETYLIKGMSFLLLGETAAAEESFKKCSEIQIEDENYKALIEQKLNNEFGNLYILMGEYDKAIGYYEANLDLVEDPLVGSISRFGIGKCYFYLKNYEKSVENLEYGLKLFDDNDILMPDPNFQHFEFFQELGKSYLRMGNLEKSREYFEKIVKVKDGIEYNRTFEIPFAEVSTSIGLGEIALAKGENNTARTYFNTGLKIFSSLNPVFFNEKVNIHFLSLVLHYNIATAYYNDGNLVMALQEIQEAENVIASITEKEKPFMEAIQWFDNGQNIFQNITSLKNKVI